MHVLVVDGACAFSAVGFVDVLAGDGSDLGEKGFSQVLWEPSMDTCLREVAGLATELSAC